MLKIWFMPRDILTNYLQGRINMIKETQKMNPIKSFRSENYNQDFNTETGYHEYWGSTKEVNPSYCEYGPSILDIEISSGYCNGGECSAFCYKSNGSHHKTVDNMSLELFKSILDKTNKDILTQIAFGICSINSNPYMFDIFQYCRDCGIIPNYTCNGIGITEEIAQKTKQYCGAVAVSVVNKEASFDAIKRFTDAGMTQVNFHVVLHKNNIESALDIMDAMATDPRLAKMNAIVFLQYKPKGAGVGLFDPVADVGTYKRIVEHANRNKISIGFDSCSAPLYLKTLLVYYPHLYPVQVPCIDPCESGLHSFYCNYKGEFFPCSFAEGEGEWKEGLNIADYDSLVDLWKDPKIEKWRQSLIKSSSGCKCAAKKDCRNCMLFPEITGCKNV
jgi:hypothetical protein